MKEERGTMSEGPIKLFSTRAERYPEPTEADVALGAHDAQLFTNDREKLPSTLGHDVSHQSAHVPEIAKVQAPEIAPKQERGYDFGISM
jgi:hypothetical protein